MKEITKTDLNAIKEVSKLILFYPIEDCLTSIPTIITHPFANSSIILLNKDEMIDITIKENEEKWKNSMIQRINNSNNIIDIYMLINKPYKLFWFDSIKKFLSEKDYGELLADVWISSENPNQDVNVSLNKCINLFKKANINYLMTKEDKKVFDNIPDIITLYRGVSTGRNPYGLSYTKSLEKASWFQNRFGEGYIITLKIKKEDIFCYFNTRNEDEYVVNTNNYKTEIKNQIPKYKDILKSDD